MLAALPKAVEAALSAVEERAALTGDPARLLDALPPLVQVVRYGDVRATPVERVTPVLEGLLARALAGLRTACVALGEDLAEEMLGRLDATHGALALSERADLRADWSDALAELADDTAVAPAIRGRAVRLAVEAGRLEAHQVERRIRHALGAAQTPLEAARWLDGLVRGPARLLLHEEGVWEALDRWLVELPGDAFVTVLPLLRRAFSGFGTADRRRMGQRLAGSRPQQARVPVDRQRAARVLPVLATVLGAPRG